MKTIRVMTIFGTRPEAIKMAPLVKELEGRAGVESLCCVTAQHREMLDSVLHIFQLTPQYDLNIMEPRQTLSTITSKCLLGVEQVLQEAKPDLVLVHGDTSTTFSGALAAFYQRVMVGHVEAGLRTYDKYSPFPEEMNRTLVGDIADLHFCPTRANRENLEREGIADGVFITGNTVIDAMATTVVKDYHFSTRLLNELDYDRKKVILVTCHRRENYGAPMEHIMTALRRLAENGQIATQYTTPEGILSGETQWNPNGSVWAVEGITSPDGRVLGKMAHSERRGANLYKNVPGAKDQRIFESGVAYFQ